MERVDAPEILDSDACSEREMRAALASLSRTNRWFGGVTTTQEMVERAAREMGAKRLSMLEVAAGTGEVAELVRRGLARKGIELDLTLLDRSPAHLPGCDDRRKLKRKSVVGDALGLPFRDAAFDLVSCNLFAHHLAPRELARFAREGLRVSRRYLLINDLVRHPVHLALVYASLPLMLSRVAWLDGLTSVRRAYLPSEMASIVTSALGKGARLEILCHYLFRMGVMVRKNRGPGLPESSRAQRKI